MTQILQSPKSLPHEWPDVLDRFRSTLLEVEAATAMREKSLEQANQSAGNGTVIEATWLDFQQQFETRINSLMKLAEQTALKVQDVVQALTGCEEEWQHWSLLNKSVAHQLEKHAPSELG